MSHYAKQCPACGIVWEQCRCIGPKETRQERCPACRIAKADDRTDYFCQPPDGIIFEGDATSGTPTPSAPPKPR